MTSLDLSRKQVSSSELTLNIVTLNKFYLIVPALIMANFVKYQ